MATTRSALVEEQQKEVDDQLFTLLIKKLWLGSLLSALKNAESEGIELDFSGHFFGGWPLSEAWALKNKAHCERLDEKSFQALVEELLREELDAYGVTLQWRTVHGGLESARRLYLISD
jgi:hypothetical protein